jgi:hypothetical protein
MDVRQLWHLRRAGIVQDRTVDADSRQIAVMFEIWTDGIHGLNGGSFMTLFPMTTLAAVLLSTRTFTVSAGSFKITAPPFVVKANSLFPTPKSLLLIVQGPHSLSPRTDPEPERALIAEHLLRCLDYRKRWRRTCAAFGRKGGLIWANDLERY